MDSYSNSYLFPIGFPSGSYWVPWDSYRIHIGSIGFASDSYTILIGFELDSYWIAIGFLLDS